MSCVYGICAFVLRCFFFCSQTVLQMEHSLGVKFFFFSSSLSSCKSCIFLNTLSPVLSTPLSYVCCVCMDRLMANFAGTCTSDNKGLLLLLKTESPPPSPLHARRDSFSDRPAFSTRVYLNVFIYCLFFV